MKFTETGIWQNFINQGSLPKLEVETYVADDTIIKLGLTVTALIVVTVLMIKLSKSK